MAVVSFCQDQKAPNARVRRGKFNSYQVALIVTVDDVADDGGVITNYLENNGFAMWSTYAQPNFTDIGSIVTGITASRRAGSQLIWDAVVSYEGMQPNENEEDDDGNQTDNPLEFRYQITAGTVPYQVPVWAATNIEQYPEGGTPACAYQRSPGVYGPVVNSAGTVLDPPLMRTLYDTTYRFTGNYQFYDQSYMDNVLGLVNATDVEFSDKLIGSYGMAGGEIFPANTILCTSASATYKRTNGVEYWEYSYEFQIRNLNPDHVAYKPDEVPHGWNEQILDQGVQRYAWEGCDDADGGTYAAGDLFDGRGNTVPILGLDGKRTPEKVNLNGKGQPNVDISPTLPAPADGFWFSYRTMATAAFYFPQTALDIFKPKI